MKKTIKILLSIISVLFLSYFFFGGRLEQQVQKDLNKIEIKVALDAEKQYKIAKKNGALMDAYVQAGFVAAAYLQAEDELNYKKWKQIEFQHAKDLGLK